MLENYETLTVRQEVEMLQVFTGLETKNRYKIIDPAGDEVLFAYEESGFIGRQFLGSHRPLTLNVIGSDGNVLLKARRKFFWFFSHLEFLSAEGEPIGSMQRRFKLIGRRFDLADSQGNALSIDGPLLRPNTFWLSHTGGNVAKITKQWSGISREMFSVADTFHVEFTDSTLPESIRWLILGAAFSIDLDFFENRGGGFGFRFGGLGGFGHHGGIGGGRYGGITGREL